MNIHLDNVNFSSNSGPNSFARKLHKYIGDLGVSFDPKEPPDAVLCFIETSLLNSTVPLIQRLDGIYFNTSQNYDQLNSNIRRTYDLSEAVVFQSEFNKELTFKYFGAKRRYAIIHNGADVRSIEKIKPLPLDKYDKVWACASSWRPHKRLQDNIRYFLEHSGENDGLIIAGKLKKEDILNHPRIHYTGELNPQRLISVYKRADYFLHLAWLDHCPNVVIDARACGCQIICSSAGGTKEIAGLDAIIIEEDPWDFSPVELYAPPSLDFTKKAKNNYNTPCSMVDVANNYKDFIEEIL